MFDAPKLKLVRVQARLDGGAITLVLRNKYGRRYELDLSEIDAMALRKKTTEISQRLWLQQQLPLAR